MSGDPPMRGGMKTVDRRVISDRGSLRPRIVTSGMPRPSPRLRRDTGGWAGEASERMTNEEGAR
jgi:hypothetical protein